MDSSSALYIHTQAKPKQPSLSHPFLTIFFNQKICDHSSYTLTISQGKTCALLNSVQKFIETQGWLPLTFFICLHNQLSSLNSIIAQMSEKRDSSNRQ